MAHGDFELAPLVRVWPRGAAADALPARSFGSIELRALPLALREALVRAHVTLGAAPILSPRRRWGWLFMNTGMLGGLFHEEDVEGFCAFVAQLALLLDGADLLARTVAVERALAHAEKLAAIGELAARIAHEIRNPVAAARRPGQAPRGARQPARERARCAGDVPLAATGHGRRPQRGGGREPLGHGQRPRRPRRRAAAPLRALLLHQAERDGPRSRDRAPCGRGPRRADRRRP